MVTRQLVLPGEIVKKSNALARARWTVESVWEPRLVALLASKVHVDDTDFHVYEIPVSEILHGSSGRDYQEIASVVDKIMSRVLTIHDEDGWTKYNVFTRCRYRKKDGILELGFHPDLRQHYLQLKKNFAKWNLLEYLMLPSIYSQRIFEILKSWDDQPEVILSVSELNEMLDTPPSLRKDFKEFRRRVLEKAHKDIHTHTQLRFEWEPIKVGKSVEKIRFTFGARRALAEKVKADAKEEKRRRLANQRLLRAVECANKKNGDCRTADNVRIVCRVCADFKCCESVRQLNQKGA